MINKNQFKLIATMLLLTFALAACSKKVDETFTPAKELYEKGLGLLEDKKYNKAAEVFEQIFFQHPGHSLTPQAELMQAYSLFLDGQYEEAADVLDVFISLHPLNIDIAYAYYLKALSYYMEINNVKLDQTSSALAKQAFEDVIKRFPGTKYAIDAALKMDLINEHLAGQQMEIGRYYLNKKNPIAAINRFKEVIANYPTTSHVQEALYRMVESYITLGLFDDAKKYAAVLGHNHPDSKWYRYSYALIQKVQ